jgi:putative endonuclease
MLRGEIDIIASDRKTLVFVEVKTRSRPDFGRPEEAVTPAKQKQIRKIAQAYLIKKRLGEVECRFDVLSLLFDPDQGFAVHHIKNAF